MYDCLQFELVIISKKSSLLVQAVSFKKELSLFKELYSPPSMVCHLNYIRDITLYLNEAYTGYGGDMNLHLNDDAYDGEKSK